MSHRSISTSAILTALLAVTCILCADGRPARAQDAVTSMPVIKDLLKARPEDEELTGRRWRLTADTLSAEHDARIVEATGEVLIKSGDDYLLADFVRYFVDTRWVFLRGNIRMRVDNYHIEADEAEFDLANQVGWLRKGRLLSPDPLVSIAGETIRKTGPNTYEFDKATLTTCEGDRPAWQMRVSSAKVTAEDEAVLKNPRVEILGTPLLYFPYLSISTITQRTTGVLNPEFGSSSRLGRFARLPIYVVLGEENDLTLFEGYFTDRGFQQGLEWRSTPNAQSKSLFQMEWLYDDEIAPTEEDENSKFDDDGLVRPNRNRFWLRGKHNGYLGDPRWEFKLDADFVSDQNYLREFDVGQLEFSDSRQLLLDEFGRDIAVSDSLTRTTQALFFRDFSQYSFNVDAAYTQNLAFGNDNGSPQENPTVQRLPAVSVFAFRQNIGNTFLEWEADTELAHLWRKFGNTATRLDLRPTLSAPFTLGRFSIIPRAGVRETIYANNQNTEEDGFDERDAQFRTLPEASVSLFTELFRVYDTGDALLPLAQNVGQGRWTRLKHSIQPRLEYNFIAEVDQADLPDLDDEDRIDAVNELRYSIENVFERKRARVVLAPQQGTAFKPQVATDYSQFLRIRLEQAYDIEEAGRDEELDDFPRRPFSDILGEIILTPDKYVQLASRTFFSPYEGEVTEHQHDITLSKEGRGWFRVRFDFLNPASTFSRRDDERLSVLELDTKINITRDWELTAGYEVDLRSDRDLEKRLGLTYRHHCFDFGLEVKDDGFDTSFLFRINLRGLSSSAFEL